MFIISDPSYSWQTVSGQYDGGGVAFGNEGSGQPIFLCRAQVNGLGRAFGKIGTTADYRGCNVATDTGLSGNTTYDVLVKP